MIQFYPNEIFREIEIGYPLQRRYALSDRSRLISYAEKFEDGILIKGGNSDGYKTLRYFINNNGKRASKVLFVHKLIAALFIPKLSEDHTHVIHLDYNRSNDKIANLKWATYAEALAHRKNSPHVKRSMNKLLEHKIKSDGPKLTVTKVIHLKKLLQDPNRKTRMKMLAKQFGISEMQVSRIKSGENWGHVKV